MSKVSNYDRRGDPPEYLNSFKTHMSLRGTTPIMECRAFHLTLSGTTKVWHTRLQAKSIQSWLDFKKAFVKLFATSSLRHEATTRRLVEKFIIRFIDEMAYYVQVNSPKESVGYEFTLLERCTK